MVMCTTMDSVVVPRPPPIAGLLPPEPPSHQNAKRVPSTSSGFRLLNNDAQDDTGSVYSVYKQKIDQMFESDSSHSTKNSVQARIEKMFTDVAIDNGIPINDIGVHHFSVDYLGSIPLGEKVTSLAGLQSPLKDLYFAYRKKSERISKVQRGGLTGKLEISAHGLKVQYLGEKGDLEQLNSFPTIAVWSAVKFVLQDDFNFAFLPLITDPDNLDKQQLFKSLSTQEKKYITLGDSHSPLFAVVMRKIGVHKQLECHGFVCQTSEDAIVIAATLYKSLMAHMKAKEKKVPKNRNGVTCMSVASSSFHDNLSHPVRPPRKKRSSSGTMESGTSSMMSDFDVLDGDADTQPLINSGNGHSDMQKEKKKDKKRAPQRPNQGHEDLDAILPYEEPNEVKVPLGDKWNTFISNHQKQITAEIKQVMSESTNMGLKRVKSLRKRNEELKKTDNTGDILTKVTIPRSGSFLNAGGLTRYKSKVHRLNGQATGGSPLGFNELFNEFRLQEGLHSMDEILGVIIDPEGMSFNDLKPIYKEFLLKLSVTLTKDELYQRSKSIMRRQKKKLLRRNFPPQTHKKRVVLGSKFKKLKHVFQKIKKAPLHDKAIVLETKIPESSISSSSYDTRHFTPKEHVTRQRMGHSKRSSRRELRHSTSEESDFFSLRRRNRNHNRHSSSGYVSCSECSFDSDTCTCMSADKCYCSLGHHKGKCKEGQGHAHGHTHHDHDEVSLTWCGCDTDSCTDSNKCYCPITTPALSHKGHGQGQNATIFDQLRQRGFIPSSESNTDEPLNRKLCKKYSNTKSSKSLEFVHNPTDYQPLDYEKHFCQQEHIQQQVAMQRMQTPTRNQKKSQEIAALFADIKLSSPRSKLVGSTPRAHYSPSDYYKPKNLNQRMIANSLYSVNPYEKAFGSGPMPVNPLGAGKINNNHLYSTKNGLYTIQSQSDDSSNGRKDFARRSMNGQHAQLSREREFKGTNGIQGHHVQQMVARVQNSSLENSLGYLP
ncbi:uncharacterized protein [Atheta coriaria]|uniref:uncharacterized protein n=1 Tax=Dalotia coriaria TaxID=877792 RepID=UPI0031F44898